MHATVTWPMQHESDSMMNVLASPCMHLVEVDAYKTEECITNVGKLATTKTEEESRVLRKLLLLRGGAALLACRHTESEP